MISEKRKAYLKKFLQANKEKYAQRRKAYHRAHYLANKAKYCENVRNRRRIVRAWLDEYKKTVKCERCPEDHPACMTFHHTDPAVKDETIANAARNWSLARVQRELAKCIPLCANCHAKLHWAERHGDEDDDEDFA